jgi:putative phosphoribosyl transferase
MQRPAEFRAWWQSAAPPLFDRRDAGRRLAAMLERFAGTADLLVLALPRGGVPVAYEVASALDAPLDVFLVRKLGVPGNEELAMGAIASGGIRALNDDVIASLHIDEATLDAVTAEETRTIAERERTYRGDRPRPRIAGRTIILVDDGLATGASMRAGLTALRGQDPKRLVAAVPVAPPEACDALKAVADDVISAITPSAFYGVGRWYRNFTQTTDEEVRDLLNRSAAGRGT